MSDVNILLVEDESIEAMDIKRTLESFGFKVPYVASSGEKALEKAIEIKPDLILMDIIIRGQIDGIDVASSIKKLNIPVIFLTAHPEDDTIERAKLTEPYGYIVKPYDSTELKHVIKLAIYKNKMEKEFLDSIIENIPNMIFIKSADGLNFEMINKAGEQLLGHSKEEILGKNDYDFFPDDEADFFTKNDREVLKNRKLLDIPEETIDTKNLGKRILHTKKIPLLDNDGNPQYLLGISEDITELKRAENSLNRSYEDLELKVQARTSEILKSQEELRETNRYNRELLEVSIDPLVTIGSDGNITDVNKAVELVTGYPRDKLIGTDFSNYFTDYDKAKAGYKEVFRKGFVKNYALEIKHKNGDITPVLYNASVYKNENGDIIGVFAAARDISQLKRAENKLQNVINKLEISNKELKEFAYVASHDLKEPLRMITSFLKLLEGKYKDNLNEEAKDYINFAMDGAYRMDMMINDLLEYSRVESKEIEFKYFNSEKILEKALNNLKPFIDENNAMVTYESLPVIYANEPQIIQLFQNLLSNGIKYCDKKIPRIHISSITKDNNYIFKVEDNGIGIDEAQLKRIFVIFQRLHTSDEYNGTGIGLAISKKIVQNHRGKIWAKSELGIGTSFYFTIPNQSY
ncbi:MAG: PAS domain S-box protein [Methanobacterium sp.]|uniref:PAS domain S-box protein n=1 Tax=Methanobacterium sp. TaxID=2164 RepID=UPI003C76C9C7